MDKANPTDRLTEREKECLRRWLGHQTAKEIALDLGISHHAVEKRLKMARMKLGVASSLEAARLLADAEGYQQPVAQPADLPIAVEPEDGWRSSPVVIGALAMILCTALSLALMQQAATSPASSASDRIEASDPQIAEVTRRTFDHLDADGSGFLEQPESPFIGLALLEPVDPARLDAATTLSGDLASAHDDARLAEFYAAADRDGDGRVSYAEYHAWSVPQLARLGIDLVNGLAPGS